MYNIIALMGESGVGKDSMMQEILHKLNNASAIHEIISCTSRPKRDYEIDGVNYYFYSVDQFINKIANGEMLEFANFNNWWYGTSYDSIQKDKINIGVFNPSGVRQLLDRKDCHISIYWVRAADKTRLLRQLNRETYPDVKEIIRRFGTDYEDFQNIDFDFIEIINEDEQDFHDGVEKIVGQIETLLAQGQN